jgi:hypothetical protein
LAALVGEHVEGSERWLQSGTMLQYYSVTVCLPAILIAVIIIAIYLKERNKKLQ